MPVQIATFTPVKLEPYRPGAKTEAYSFAPSQTIARGTILGQITSAGATKGQVKAYASGNSDGTQVAIGVAVYDLVTDASSNITIGPSGATPDLIRGVERTAPVYKSGEFRVSDLTGLDATAISTLNATQTGTDAGATLVIPSSS